MSSVTVILTRVGERWATEEGSGTEWNGREMGGEKKLTDRIIKHNKYGLSLISSVLNWWRLKHSSAQTEPITSINLWLSWPLVKPGHEVTWCFRHVSAKLGETQRLRQLREKKSSLQGVAVLCTVKMLTFIDTSSQRHERQNTLFSLRTRKPHG